VSSLEQLCAQHAASLVLLLRHSARMFARGFEDPRSALFDEYVNAFDYPERVQNSKCYYSRTYSAIRLMIIFRS
jgi:hypothetical protein